MAVYLGIDTSNYTTSAAAFDDVSGCVFQKKMLLPVKSGERGLRQSDAVFIIHSSSGRSFLLLSTSAASPDFIGASYAPREWQRLVYAVLYRRTQYREVPLICLGVPLYEFSHQAGHVAAAVYSSGHIELF